MKLSFYKIIFHIVLSLFICITISAQDTLQKGIELYRSGEYKSAVNTLKKIRKSDNDSYLGFHYLGLAYEKQNKIKKALKAFKRSVELNSEFAKAKTALAHIYLRRGKVKAAIENAKESIQLDSDDYLNYYTLAYSYYKLKNNSEAIKYVNKLIEKRPNYVEAYLLKYKVFDTPTNLGKDEVRKLYKEKHEIIINLIIKVAESPDSKYWQKEREAVEYFAKYYKEKKALENVNEDKEIRRA